MLENNNKQKEREKVNSLAKIILDTEYVCIGTRTSFGCPGGGDGHSFKDACEEYEEKIYKKKYTHTRTERSQARKELKILRRNIVDNTAIKIAKDALRQSSVFHYIVQFSENNTNSFFFLCVCIGFGLIMIVLEILARIFGWTLP